MLAIEKPKIQIIEESSDKRFGRFVVEPLERGYGTTLGNSLRRMLISSLPGAAARSIDIQGVQHEFQAVKGVVEDVTEIIMNVKNIAFKVHSEEEKVVSINVKGPAVVTAEDIAIDSDIEVINTDQHIATVSEGGQFEMLIYVGKGRGFVPADGNKKRDLPIGVIPIDSIYTPVSKVNYTVEKTRVGQSTDFDKLILDVTTNGTITANDALALAPGAGEGPKGWAVRPLKWHASWVQNVVRQFGLYLSWAQEICVALTLVREANGRIRRF